MQLCALDHNRKLIFVNHAQKQKNYLCIECENTVRIRGGQHRQSHFYHLHPNQACHLHAKGMPHIMLQNHIKQLLPINECLLEYRFPEIGRIADVVWFQQNIVYEIQCSPISAEEILSRNASYASIGLQVVWILDDSRYNQYRLSSAEDILLNFPHYFSNMDSQGKGMIYDQFSFINKGMRLHNLPSTRVDLSRPKQISKTDIYSELPKKLLNRLENWPLFFYGDSIDIFLNDKNQRNLFLEILDDQQDFLSMPIWTAIMKIYYKWIAAPYFSILRLLLERTCR